MQKTYSENVKNLSLVIERIPFSVCTNLIMPKSQRQRKIPERYKNADIFVTRKPPQEKSKNPHLEIILEQCEQNGSTNNPKNQLQVHINRSVEMENLIDNNIRVSTPLVDRLRKFDKQDYFESSLEESVNKSTTKIPIYKQKLHLETKTNKDPYAFNFIDNDKPKTEKLNNFDKFMHDALLKLEKKDKKRKVTKKKTLTYKKNITKALNRVMTKINTKKVNTSIQHKSPYKSINKIGIESSEGFLGFDKIVTSSENVSTNNIDIDTQKEPSGINSSDFLGFDNKNLTKNQPISFINNSVIDFHSTPKKNINILSNICLSTNSNLLNNETIQSDDYIEDNDEYFGFTDNETTPVERIYKKKYLPWRFQGFFKRNPHILIIKKNGLPSQQQEMVIDYEFVKRIEDLFAKNSNKNPEPPPQKSPKQYKIINFIETEQDYTHTNIQQSTRLSLFNYEEFIIPKKILGDNNINKVSTPKKQVVNVVVSPNVSIIPRDEENKENKQKFYRSYKRNTKKCILEKDCDETDDTGGHLFEDIEEEKDIDLSIKLPTAKYGKKTQRKRQISEGSDGEEKKSKKKKKDTMTKAEKAEFESWIEKTNAEFKEVSKHELTLI